MGRYSTGAITTIEVIRIELSYLLKTGFIQKNKNVSGILDWTDGSKIKIESCYNSTEAYIRLSYIITDRNTEKVKEYDYKIYLTTVPSNLRIGNVLYFVCPVSGKKCRILYKCYGSEIWKSREAYQNRIYYHTQQVSKYDYNNTRYWAIDKELKKLYKKQVKSHYQGKPTRLQNRIDKLEIDLEKFDYLRWTIVPKAVSKLLATPQYEHFGI